jgi:hypothetical protein
MAGLTTRARFERHYSVAPSGCWEWNRPEPNGYGKFTLVGNGKRRCVWAHIVSYTLNVGTVPAGLELDHLCRNTRCVNPAHLEPVTRRENVMRSNAPCAVVARTNRCKRGHEYTSENTIINPTHGGRQCRACVHLSGLKNRRARGIGITHKDKTHCKHGHEFTPENTLRTKRGHRICRTCRQVISSRLAIAKRAERRESGALMRERCRQCPHTKSEHNGGIGKCACGCGRYLSPTRKHF